MAASLCLQACMLVPILAGYSIAINNPTCMPQAWLTRPKNLLNRLTLPTGGDMVLLVPVHGCWGPDAASVGRCQACGCMSVHGTSACTDWVRSTLHACHRYDRMRMCTCMSEMDGPLRCLGPMMSWPCACRNNPMLMVPGLAAREHLGAQDGVHHGPERSMRARLPQEGCGLAV